MIRSVVLSLFLIFITSNQAISSQVEIKFKIETEIITNQDIVNEINYLIAFNNKLKNLSSTEIKKIAINSAIQEKIKLIKLKEVFNLDEDAEDLKKILIENLLNNFNFDNLNELQKYFDSSGVRFENVLYKLKLEFLWNEFIYKSYINKVSIDKEKLKNKIKKDIKNKSFVNEYFMREILFELNNEDNLKSKNLKIIEVIKNKSFEEAATIFSISNTSAKGGKLGWIKNTELNNQLAERIKTLDLGDITDPIKVANGYLILKLENKRKIDTNIDFNKEFNSLIRKETDRQLNQFSIIYFNKLKKNISIHEK
tara:strand:+ start:367 stop:1299 length:933 start_codon:yes stop_codon:yes gene_type:complete